VLFNANKQNYITTTLMNTFSDQNTSSLVAQKFKPNLCASAVKIYLKLKLHAIKFPSILSG